MCRRIPAFKEFYSLGGGVEEHQVHRATWDQWHNGIRAMYKMLSQETMVTFGCGKSSEDTQWRWCLSWALRLWKDFRRVVYREEALEAKRSMDENMATGTFVTF